MNLLHFISNMLLLAITVLLNCDSVLALPSSGVSLNQQDDITTTPNPLSTVFNKRDITDVNCLAQTGQRTWKLAPLGPILSGIKYLRNIEGGFGICTVAKTSCTRISCNNDAAIYWCNNNNFELRKYYFMLADYAQALVDKCTVVDVAGKGSLRKRVGGQAWDRINWNVFIRAESC
ncbi:hypothetical protein ONS95_005382 [Cadophora gregata]|uniref:uncharacterized protein n=1 Tax=Cadophora gregata TaxID=51156 RepID=UPI0026DB8FFF|nr:uncharacterized protein ONS95_005382 [Cadophora gregata]KAK0103356.1 hypothetical protein ONS95_005382 [Cadophora gregata]KAK0107546.1 hypothetical protein ONS96_003353 [Cadophora gregata f. sp. sojae]